MDEPRDDLDAELEELVETDGVSDVEDVGSVGDLDAEFDDVGIDPDRGSTAGTDPIGIDVRTERTERAESSTENGGRVRSWLGSFFSTRWFGAVAVASGVGVLAAGAIPLPFMGYLGIILAGAIVGLATSERRYLEVAVAGALAAAVATFFNAVALVLLFVGLPLVAIAAVLGAVSGVLGHYAGRDLRHGLTREI